MMMQCIRITVPVSAENEPAIALYRRAGYQLAQEQVSVEVRVVHLTRTGQGVVACLPCAVSSAARPGRS